MIDLFLRFVYCFGLALFGLFLGLISGLVYWHISNFNLKNLAFLFLEMKLDGAVSPPPPSPAAPVSPIVSGMPQMCNIPEAQDPQENQQQDLPAVPAVVASVPPRSTSIPEPPPWSEFLPSHYRTVICRSCLANCHGIQFSSCMFCHEAANLVPTGTRPKPRPV